MAALVASIGSYRWIRYVLPCIAVIIVCYWWWGRCEPVTTVFVVRHAEKAATPAQDPPLTAAGLTRAGDLARVLADVALDAVFASEFQRTQLTVQPTAVDHGIAIQAVPAADTSSLVARILGEHQGSTVLVAGHSNTVPTIVAQLGGGDVGAIAEDDFDNLFVVNHHERCGTHLARLHYGAPD